MLTYLWRSFGSGSALPDQTPVDPLKDLIVVSDKDREEDDFCEISVRPMTWAEVASGAMGRTSRKVVIKTPRVAPHRREQQVVHQQPPAIKTVAWESNELYGELEDDYVTQIEKKRRRKSFKKRRDSL